MGKNTFNGKKIKIMLTLLKSERFEMYLCIKIILLSPFPFKVAFSVKSGPVAALVL